MPREAVAHELLRIAMILRVQNSGLFPEGPLQLQGHYFAAKIFELLREFVRHPRAERVSAHRSLVRLRSKLHLHEPPQIFEFGGFVGWIVKNHHWRMGVGIYLELHPCRAAWTFAEHF